MDEYRYLKHILLFINSIYNSYLIEYSALSNLLIEFRNNDKKTVLTEDGRFISPQLKEKINKIDYLGFKKTLYILGVSVFVEIYKPLNYDVNNERIKKIFEVIGFIVYLCKTINTKFKGDVNIKLVLSPFKKVISNNKDHLTAYNVNSGFTIRYVGKSDIVIFREEEIIKVLIHELLHSFDIDSKTINDVYDLEFMRIFNKETKINLNESFTESFACLINVCLASIYYSKRHKKTLIDNFLRLIENERKYILSVGEKVGKYNKSNRIEQTNITSYYVLKAVNWINIEDFAKYMVRNRYMIGKYRDYVQYLGNKLNKNKENIINFNFDKNTVNIKSINDMSIRMSSIDILNI